MDGAVKFARTCSVIVKHLPDGFPPPSHVEAQTICSCTAPLRTAPRVKFNDRHFAFCNASDLLIAQEILLTSKQATFPCNLTQTFVSQILGETFNVGQGKLLTTLLGDQGGFGQADNTRGNGP
jgi:hypothetical protein